MKNYLTVAIFSLLVATPLTSFAQTNTQNAPQLQVYVINLTLDKSTYTAGDTINGTTTLFNNSSVNIPSADYDFILAGGYGPTGVPTEIYDKTTPVQFFIGAGQKKTVTFSYVIPSNLSGSNFGIRAETMIGGSVVGWDDATFSISSSANAQSGSLNILSANLVASSTYYGAEEGPTVSAEDNTHLVLTLQNPGTADLTVTPQVSVYSQNIDNGTSVLSFALPSLTVTNGATSSLNVPIDVSGLKPGVYEGQLALVDGNNQNIAPLIPFRFIVRGAIVTIHSVVSPSTSVYKGDPFTVSAYITGTPFEVSDNYQYIVKGATLSLQVFNENNTLVASTSFQSDIGPELNHTFNLIAANDAKSLSAALTVYDSNGVVLASYQTDLSGNGSNTNTSFFNSLDFELIIGLLVLILVVSFAFLFKRRSINTLLLVFFIGGVILFSLNASKTHAYVVYHYLTGSDISGTYDITTAPTQTSIPLLAAPVIDASNDPEVVQGWGLIPSTIENGGQIDYGVLSFGLNNVIPNESLVTNYFTFSPIVTVASPYDNQVFSPGENIQLEMNVSFYACGNSPSSVQVAVGNNMYDSTTNTQVPVGTSPSVPQTYTEPIGVLSTVGQAFPTDFNWDITAPTQPGTYFIPIYVDNYHQWEHGGAISSTFSANAQWGYVPIVVEATSTPTSTPSVVTTSPDLCAPNVSTQTIGEPVTWAVKTASTTPLDFTWSDSVLGTDDTGSVNTYTPTYTETSTPTVSVTVISNGIVHTDQCGQVSITGGSSGNNSGTACPTTGCTNNDNANNNEGSTTTITNTTSGSGTNGCPVGGCTGSDDGVVSLEAEVTGSNSFTHNLVSSPEQDVSLRLSVNADACSVTGGYGTIWPNAYAANPITDSTTLFDIGSASQTETYSIFCSKGGVVYSDSVNVDILNIDEY